MNKILNGSEIASFVKERQAKAVRGIWGVDRVKPTLAIVSSNPNPVSDVYLRVKSQYAEDIGAMTKLVHCSEAELLNTIKQLNDSDEVHGIIVQLPLQDASLTDSALNSIVPSKDVDGLSASSPYDPPTPIAILWLLSGYAIDFLGKKTVVVGRGRLVGDPLTHMLDSMSVEYEVVDIDTKDKDAIIKTADILITATGSAGSIRADMVKAGAVVVDAGTSSESGTVMGDVADDVRLRDDIKITPTRGGVGPLTVAALFENVITATRNQLQ